MIVDGSTYSKAPYCCEDRLAEAIHRIVQVLQPSTLIGLGCRDVGQFGKVRASCMQSAQPRCMQL